MDLMVDLETLDTKPGAIILSIGAMAFDSKTGANPLPLGLQGGFYERLSQKSQLPLHMTASAETVKWWSEQSAEAADILTDRMQETALPIEQALTKLDQYVLRVQGQAQQPIENVWCQGQDFDFPILHEAYRRVWDNNANLPWAFWQQRDTRTAYDVLGFDTSTVKRTGTHHNALQDCFHQIRCLIAAKKGAKHFNGLSPAEQERLAMMAEEAAEVIQASMKIMRHGYDSYRPDDPKTDNRELLQDEVEDLAATQRLMIIAGDIDGPTATLEAATKRKLRYAHHQ